MTIILTDDQIKYLNSDEYKFKQEGYEEALKNVIEFLSVDGQLAAVAALKSLNFAIWQMGQALEKESV